MGKALVIKGLEVANPLTSVSFLNPDTILSEYLAENTSITDTEKTALGAFVDGLMSNGLLSKMRYFYPMLGNNVTDMLIDVISPATEDLLSNIDSATDLSVSDRMLNVSSGVRSVDVNALIRFKNTDWKNFGIITSTYCGSMSQFTTLRVSGQNGNNSFNIFPLSGAFTERPPRMLAGYSGSALSYIPASAIADERTYLDRIIFAQVNGDVAQLYKEKNLYASGTSYVNDITYLNDCKILGGNITTYKFFAITNPLSQAEYTTFYELLLAFLQAVGKHA